MGGLMRKRSLARCILHLLTDYYIIYTRGTLHRARSLPSDETLQRHQPLIARSVHYGTLLCFIGGRRADAAEEKRESDERERRSRLTAARVEFSSSQIIEHGEGGASSTRKRLYACLFLNFLGRRLFLSPSFSLSPSPCWGRAQRETGRSSWIWTPGGEKHRTPTATGVFTTGASSLRDVWALLLLFPCAAEGVRECVPIPCSWVNIENNCIPPTAAYPHSGRIPSHLADFLMMLRWTWQPAACSSVFLSFGGVNYVLC